MDIQQLSAKYRVRRLTDGDIPAVYDLQLGNPLFFEHCPPLPAPETVAQDLRALPPRTTYDDKYYVGFFDGDTLIAVLDLILHYPDRQTAFIGFFMMKADRQGGGQGSAIIEELAACLRARGYEHMRLGYVNTNPQSRAFWLKNRFCDTGVEAKTDAYTMVVLQRELI